MNEALIVTNRPRVFFWIIGQIFFYGGILFYLYTFFYAEQHIDGGMLALLFMLLISGLLSGFYKNEVSFDKKKNLIEIKTYILMNLVSKEFSLDDFFLAGVEEDNTSYDNGEFRKEAVHSSGVKVYYVCVYPKVASKYKKIEVRKVFNMTQAEKIVDGIINYTGFERKMSCRRDPG